MQSMITHRSSALHLSAPMCWGQFVSSPSWEQAQSLKATSCLFTGQENFLPSVVSGNFLCVLCLKENEKAEGKDVKLFWKKTQTCPTPENWENILKLLIQHCCQVKSQAISLLIAWTSLDVIYLIISSSHKPFPAHSVHRELFSAAPLACFEPVETFRCSPPSSANFQFSKWEIGVENTDCIQNRKPAWVIPELSMHTSLSRITCIGEQLPWRTVCLEAKCGWRKSTWGSQDSHEDHTWVYHRLR